MTQRERERERERWHVSDKLCEFQPHVGVALTANNDTRLNTQVALPLDAGKRVRRKKVRGPSLCLTSMFIACASAGGTVCFLPGKGPLNEPTARNDKEASTPTTDHAQSRSTWCADKGHQNHQSQTRGS